ncbi:MAG: asparagine synthase (glutamine-hydrolyzing) [Candidatus Omnitrophota bacterium]
MCGICGFVGINDVELLKRMTDLLSHRGPDEGGILFKNNLWKWQDQNWRKAEQLPLKREATIGLGHRRLSIIDLTGGWQPISNEDRTLWLVSNGEIYNYRQLRDELIAGGHRFYTHSDAEVVVHLYEEYGEDFARFLNGMFALALWDSNSQKLLLARDRIGIRQMYYTLEAGKIAFASEMKSILELPGLPKDIDEQALDEFLTFRYVPGPRTIMSRIKKLPPASILVYQEGQISISRYWQIDSEQYRQYNNAALIEQFYELLQDSVKLQMVSDVAVGIYLSGGLDSSAILGLMSQLAREPINSFSVGFNSRTDELDKAVGVSDQFGTAHQAAKMDAEDLWLLPTVLWHLDEPYGDLIVVPMYLLSKMASQKVKVVLTGEGADELLGGYVYQKTMYWGYLFNKMVPAVIKNNLLVNLVKITPPGLLNAFFHYPAKLGKGGKERLLGYLSRLDSPAESYLSLTGLFNRQDKEKLYSPGFKHRLAQNEYPENLIREHFAQPGESGYFNHLLGLEFKNWLPDNILFTQDKMAMAHGIETRVPFLDHRLVELAFALPVGLKLNKLVNDKYILRKVGAKFLNRRITQRKKQAFRVPIEDTFKPTFEKMTREFLSADRIRQRGYFNRRYVEELIKNRKNDLLGNMKVATLLMLEIWFSVFMDKQKAAAHHE